MVVIKTKKHDVHAVAPEIKLNDTTGGEVNILIDGLKEDAPLRVRQWNGNQPLIIVDGEKMAKDFELKTVDPKEIESVSVLKNKSALDMYGEEGKEGVIIITKKK